MRTLLIALAISLASPAPLCMALCGVAFAEQATDATVASESQDHGMPCHESAPESNSEEACEKCGDTPSFVPAKVNNTPMSCEFVDTPTVAVRFESIDRVLTEWRLVEPPDVLNSPYVRTNPPLLN